MQKLYVLLRSFQQQKATISFFFKNYKSSIYLLCLLLHFNLFVQDTFSYVISWPFALIFNTTSPYTHSLFLSLNIVKNVNRLLKWHLHASSISMAVAVILLGDRLQHPVTPVQKAAKMATKAIINNAIIDLPMSATQKKKEKYSSSVIHK